MKIFFEESSIKKKGELIVIQKLKSFLAEIEPESYLFHEPFGRDKGSDFIILSPKTLGILLVEVKDWQSEQIIKLDWNRIKHTAYGETHPEALEGKDYNSVLRSRQAKMASALKNLRLHNKVSIIPLICFPFIERNSINSSLELLQNSVYPDQVANYHQFIFKGDVEGMALYPKNVLERISKGTSEPRANRLNQLETDTILKEVFGVEESDVIPRHKGKNAGLDACSNQLRTFIENDTVIKVLDKRQKEYVEKKPNGFLSIRGVPGSGKSVILTKRFERFSKIPGKKILFIYFTGTLDKYYQKLLDAPQQNSSHENINVMTFARLSQKFFNEHSRKYDYMSRNVSGETILKKIRSIKEYQKFIGYFDFVLVDEGQDFPPSWAEILKIMTKGEGVNKPITVAYDPDQNLSKAKIRDVLNNFDIPRNSGNSVILNTVYRNTREVFEYAMNIIGDIDPILGSRKEIEYEREDPNSLRIIDVESEAETISLIQSISREYIGTNAVSLSDIAVIYPAGPNMNDRAEELGNQIVNGKKKYLNLHRSEIQFREDPRYKINFDDKSIKLLSTNQAKGLEFKVVFLVNFEDVPDTDENRRALYVAATRAQYCLTIFRKWNSTIFEPRS